MKPDSLKAQVWSGAPSRRRIVCMRMRMAVIVCVIVRMTGCAIADRDRLGRRQDEPAGLDPLGADQAVGQLRICASGPRSRITSRQRCSSRWTWVVVTTGRGGGAGGRSAVGDPRDVVVVDQGDDAHRLALVVGDHLFDQGRAHQAADRLAPVGVAVHLAVLVELLEQLAADRDAEPDQGVFHGAFSFAGSSNAGRPLPGQLALGTSTQSPSCFELATAASTKAMPATPSAMPGCRNGVGTFSPRRADRPFERPVQVGERLVETLGMAGGEPQVGLDRAGEIAVLGPLAIERSGWPPA